MRFICVIFFAFTIFLAGDFGFLHNGERCFDHSSCLIEENSNKLKFINSKVNQIGDWTRFQLKDFIQIKRFEPQISTANSYFVSGGNFLIHLYNDEKCLITAQIGANSSQASYSTTGNIGISYRYFPFSYESFDEDSVMIGYNVFQDSNFASSELTRGGAGIESWFDWIKLSANYYFPISGDDKTKNVRSATGWDTKLKAYLPFYRNLSFSGSYSKWYGDELEVLGTNYNGNVDIYSYSVAYEPFPLFSLYYKQFGNTQTQEDMEFGLNLNYRLGVPLKSQLDHSKPSSKNYIKHSKYDFVNRQNHIVLENLKAK